MIFGCKQNSFEDNNVYHPYSYEGFIDFDKVTDPAERLAYETHVREFGQTPRKLFHYLHPRRGHNLNGMSPAQDLNLENHISSLSLEE